MSPTRLSAFTRPTARAPCSCPVPLAARCTAIPGVMWACGIRTPRARLASGPRSSASPTTRSAVSVTIATTWRPMPRPSCCTVATPHGRPWDLPRGISWPPKSAAPSLFSWGPLTMPVPACWKRAGFARAPAPIPPCCLPWPTRWCDRTRLARALSIGISCIPTASVSMRRVPLGTASTSSATCAATTMVFPRRPSGRARYAAPPPRTSRGLLASSAATRLSSSQAPSRPTVATAPRTCPS